MSMTSNDEAINWLLNIVESLEATTNDKITFKIGRMTGQYWNGDDYEWLTGDLFLKINQDTVFDLKDDKTGFIDSFDVPDSEGTIEFINTKLNYTGV